jgi:hypothetical protein
LIDDAAEASVAIINNSWSLSNCCFAGECGGVRWTLLLSFGNHSVVVILLKSTVICSVIALNAICSCLPNIPQLSWFSKSFNCKVM